MKSLNSIGLGLSLTFGCLFLALVCEIYYLLWWKRRSWNRRINEDDCCSSTTTSSSSAREFMYMFCCNKSTQQLTSSTTTVSLTVTSRSVQQQNDLVLLKSDGPQRLLFSIKEETREDLESEDGVTGRVSSSTRSMSDLVLVQNSVIDIETPYLTPLTSPSMFSPPLTPLNSSYTHLGFNPLFESTSDAELRGMKTSPPPTFKFLQEAEDKFHRKIMMEEDVINHIDHISDGCGQSEAESPSSRFKKDECYYNYCCRGQQR